LLVFKIKLLCAHNCKVESNLFRLNRFICNRFFFSFLVQILEKENEAMKQLKQRQTIELGFGFFIK